MLFVQTLHKYLVSGFVLFLFFSFSHEASCQDKTFAQFLFQDIDSTEQVQQLDSLLMSKPGIQFTRFNHVNRNLLLVFDSTQNYNQSDFEGFFEEFQLYFVCYRSGILGEDSMKELTIANCSESKPSEH